MTRINPNVKFSYDLIRGSQKERQKIIFAQNEKLYEHLYEQLENPNFKLKQLRNTYAETLPEPKKINIKRKFNPSIDGETRYSLNQQNELNGQTILLPIWFKTKPLDYIVTLIHENTHVMDILTNPKKTALMQKTDKMKSYPIGIYNRIYEDELYNFERNCTVEQKIERLKEIERNIKNILKSKKNEDKIKILNSMRYNLESEKIAYEEQLKYAQKLAQKGYKIISEDLIDYNKHYWFSEKIELLKHLIYQIIQEERKLHASNISH